MVFARIGHGSCYHHWNEIFAGVSYLSIGVPLIDNIFIERLALSHIKFKVIGVTAVITLHGPKGRVASYVL